MYALFDYGKKNLVGRYIRHGKERERFAYLGICSFKLVQPGILDEINMSITPKIAQNFKVISDLKRGYFAEEGRWIILTVE